MDPKDPRQDERHPQPQNPSDPAENTDATSSAEGGSDAIDEAGAADTRLPDAPETVGEKSSPGDELARRHDAEAVTSDRDDSPARPPAESAAADEVADESDVDISPASPGADSTPAAADSSGPEFPFTEIHGRTTLGRPFFGSLSQLSELPDHMIEHLDAESAANLKAAMENPEQSAPPVFDAETIRDMQAWFPRSTGTAADFEAPWYHSPLPPHMLQHLDEKSAANLKAVLDNPENPRIDWHPYRNEKGTRVSTLFYARRDDKGERKRKLDLSDLFPFSRLANGRPNRAVRISECLQKLATGHQFDWHTFRARSGI